MSVNYNRAKYNKAHDRKTYRKLYLDDLYPRYWDEGLGYRYRRTKHSVTGSKSYRCWKRKEVMHYQYRMYRTWKYNRETRWK